jgi:hypothetical protein
MAVCPDTAPASAPASPYGTNRTPPGSGANASALPGCPVSARAPMVRPWNDPTAVTTSGRPVSRLILNAASLASAPELQKKTRPGRPARSSRRSASSSPGSCIARFETCPSFAAWAVIASTTLGCAWPRIVVAMPPSRSVYSRPSTSQTVAPAP